jgi:hypothetical protein
MQRKLYWATALAVGLGVGACADRPTQPQSRLRPPEINAQRPQRGTGLVLESLTGLALPLIGSLGNIVIDQVNLTHINLVEDVVGNIVGLEAEGNIQGLAVSALGTTVVNENFLTQVHIASSGPGQCDVVTVDLGPIALDALGTAVSVDLPVADVTPRASGALGPLLCGLGQALQPLVSGVTAAVRGLVAAINAILI